MQSCVQTPALGLKQGTESMVYVFGCLEEGCGGGKGSWKVFRWTQSVGGHVPEEVLEDTKTEKPKDTWGLDEDDSFDLSALEEQLKSLGEVEVRTTRKKRTDPTPVVDAQCLFDGNLPSFYLVDSVDIYPGMVSHESDDEDDDEEEDERGDGIPCHSGIDDGTAEDTGDAGLISWDGEAYENDAVLRGAGKSAEEDTSFIRFMRQLSEVPDQCLRVYHADMNDTRIPYLWPSERVKDTSCSRCGSPRVCVLQCMSPLISALDEACDMVKGSSSDCYKNTPLSWSWATLAICICSSLCTQGTLVEECIDALGEA